MFLMGAKLVLSPLITMFFVIALGGDEPLSLYGFLYGGFPTAPSLFVFAQQ
jgi:predicted permease